MAILTKIRRKHDLPKHQKNGCYSVYQSTTINYASIYSVFWYWRKSRKCKEKHYIFLPPVYWLKKSGYSSLPIAVRGNSTKKNHNTSVCDKSMDVSTLDQDDPRKLFLRETWLDHVICDVSKKMQKIKVPQNSSYYISFER